MLTDQERKDYDLLINSADYPEYLRELIEKRFVEKADKIMEDLVVKMKVAHKANKDHSQALNKHIVDNNEVAVCKYCGYTSTTDMVKWHGDACKNMINEKT